MNTAAKVRQDKEAHPEKYCRVPRCLWRTGWAFGSPCRKHPATATLVAVTLSDSPHRFVRDNQDLCHECALPEDAAIHGKAA